MPDIGPFFTGRSGKARRWATVGLLVVALLLLGVYDEQLLGFFTAQWQKALGIVGLDRQAEAVQRGINGGITKRFLPAVATYAALYLSVCLLLLRSVLPVAQWRLALRLYGAVLAVYVAIVLLSKLAGDVGWAYRLSRQILDFVVSPLPVAVLYVLFRAGLVSHEAKV